MGVVTNIPGRVLQALAELYRRHGAHLVVLLALGGSVLAVVAGAVSMLFLARYIGLSSAQALTGFAIWMPIVLAAALLGLRFSPGQLRTIQAWASGQRTAEAAPDTWYAVIRLRRVVTRCLATGVLTLPGLGAYIVLEFHKPWYGVVAFTGGAAVGAMSLVILVVFSVELVTRPMLADVAMQLPPDFEPRADGVGLKVRTVAPLPVVALFAAVLVGAYGNASTNGTDRLALALGVALVSAIVATAIFVIINRSALAPIDDLIAATRRVRAGDIATPVPLISAGRARRARVQLQPDARRAPAAHRGARVLAGADCRRRGRRAPPRRARSAPGRRAAPGFA